MGAKKRRTTAGPKKPTIPGEMPPVGPGSEFRNAGDDAWYSVQLFLKGETLMVKYREFPEEQDEEFHAGDLGTSDEVLKLRRRFRALSCQLEGSDCWMVEVGMRVCALRVFGESDRRFYDAIVEAVEREEHIIVDGTENCSCFVVLSWLHGPEAGTLTSARVEDLCPIQSDAQLDPRLACFLELAKWKHGLASPCFGYFTDVVTCNPGKPRCVIQKSGGGMQTGSALLYDEGHFGYESNEDVDLGRGDHAHANAGKSDDHNSFSLDKLVENVSCIGLEGRDHVETNLASEDVRCFILVENLEKDISPLTIVDFVREATGLEIEAFVFLRLSSEPYTRGALVVDCVEDLERLCDFVVNPDQMITSSKGRPWIVSDSSATESVRPSFWCLEPDLKFERQHSAGDELKVVKLGSKEYSKAEKLRDLFMEFSDHQQQLLKRLALEEQSILDS